MQLFLQNFAHCLRSPQPLSTTAKNGIEGLQSPRFSNGKLVYGSPPAKYQPQSLERVWSNSAWYAAPLRDGSQTKLPLPLPLRN